VRRATNKNPEVMLTCCSRPEVRFRPSPTCGRRILTYAADDLCLGSGLASNRKNLSTPRDSILPLTYFLSSQPAVRYRSLPSLCCRLRCRRDAVNWLRPRTRHQPENLRNCQRTSVVLLLPGVKSIKITRFYRLCFQRSAARPQGHAGKLCNSYRKANKVFQESVFPRRIAFRGATMTKCRSCG